MIGLFICVYIQWAIACELPVVDPPPESADVTNPSHMVCLV